VSADHAEHADTIPVRVVAIEEVTPQIRRFTLEPIAGGELPAFSGGSHIIVVMRGGQRVHRNPYSLMSSPHDLGSYQISVLRCDPSRGGSAFMHEQVRVGSEIEIAHPVNLFSLAKLARKHLLLAGGIGITPFMAQLHDLRAGNVPYELHYATRSPTHGAYCELLSSAAPGCVSLYHDCNKHFIDIEGLLGQQPLGTHVYVCGPAGMITRVLDTAHALGWPDSHVHYEKFAAPPTGDAFDATLLRSGIEVHVQPDQSLLEAIEAAGVDAPYLCRGGVCGFCRTEVVQVDGELIHNDHFLSDQEKASGKVIMPCVSRARCTKLVLNL
jgi:dimethylamine monooxygenase subunit B